MKSPGYLFRSSISMRLSLIVVAFVMLIFLAAFSFVFAESREVVRAEAWGKASQTLQSTVLHIDNTLHEVEVASDNLIKVIEQNLDDPDKMFAYSRQALESNPELTGCSISFEPFYYKDKGRYFSAYSYNDGDSIQTENEGNDQYQYHCMDWYLIPTLLDCPYWIEPFKEESTVGIDVHEIFSSYSRPIHDRTGRVIGAFSLDICLDWFSKTVSAAKPYPHSYAVLLGKGGTYLVHPDSTKLFYETVFTRSLDEPDSPGAADSVLVSLGESMLAGESGHRNIVLDGESCFVFYRPFKNTGWSVAIVCPERDIYDAYYKMRDAISLISLVGVLCLMLFTWLIVRRSLRPLKLLAASTLSVTDQLFTVKVDDTRRPDEIGQLQHSFHTMQQALGNHIQQLRQLTDKLEQSNEQLAEAYERVREDERMKTAVLHKMTDKMAAPVAAISRLSRTICDSHQALDDAEITAMTARIQQNASLVTSYLTEMIRAAQEETYSHPVKPNTEHP